MGSLFFRTYSFQRKMIKKEIYLETKYGKMKKETEKKIKEIIIRAEKELDKSYKKKKRFFFFDKVTFNRDSKGNLIELKICCDEERAYKKH